MMKEVFRKMVELPEVKGLQDLDDKTTTLLHKRIIEQKPFLREIYSDFYGEFKAAISGTCQNKLLVELGSGAGFIKEVIPNTITSDVIDFPGIDKKFSAEDMPFEDNTVDAFFMINVLHHIKDVSAFFKEVNRCLKENGKLIMIEPASTNWSRFIYRRFHHEPFDPCGKWELEGTGRLSVSNQAIPWIVFFRDRATFERLFPALKISKMKQHTPFRYLISGGVAFRQLLPTFMYKGIKLIEDIVSPFNKYIGMFMTIEVIKKSE